MKPIAQHGVVNQLMLKVAIIRPAKLLCLLSFMVEIPGSIDSQHTYFHVEVVKGLSIEINCSCNKTNLPHLYR